MESNGIEVAIVGISGRYPQSENINVFFDNLKEKKELLTTFSDEELIANDLHYSPENDYVKRAGIIENSTLFDNKFFNVTNRDALLTDPQHRVFLQTAWHALEDAGCDPFQYTGDIALFAGSSVNTYLSNNIFNSDFYKDIHQYPVLLGNEKDFLCTRVSHALNLRGPSVTVQTGCSTSLVAVHMACQSLLNGECDMALAGGVTIRFPQKSGYKYLDGGILSPDGYCRPFDEQACGTVVSDGCGILVLKLLDDAIRDKDQIYCVVKGSSINNDGNDKMGFTSPSASGQKRAILDALHVSGVEASQISYIETHGTGTKLGDPIEINSLRDIYLGKEGQKVQIGSIKANIGHTDTASGITGLIKVALMMKHELLIPQINFEKPNDLLRLSDSQLEVNTELKRWDDRDGPRYAAVSSFGLGGTNVHMIVESGQPYCQATDPEQCQSHNAFLLTGRTSQDLMNNCQHIGDFSRQCDERDFDNFSYTLATGRHHFSYRKYVRASNFHEFSEKIKALAIEEEHSEITGIKIFEKKGVLPSDAFVSESCFAKMENSLNHEQSLLLNIISEVASTPINISIEYTDDADQTIVQGYTSEGEKVSEISCDVSCLTHQHVLDILGWLWEHGIEMNWKKIYSDLSVRKMSIPGYVFDAIPFEIEPNYQRKVTAQPEQQLSSDLLSIESIKAKIQALWLDDLGVEIDSEDADIYELCGDSFSALQMNVELEDYYEISLSNKTFIENNTLEKLSQVIYKIKTTGEYSTLDEHIVCFREEGDETPIFLIHPAGGTVMGCKELAKVLPEGHPVYGIQYPFRNEGDHIQSMTELAKYYNENISAIYPSGNLIIGGHSFGGNAAIEMAIQFENAGRNIEHVIMFDSHPPQAYYSNTVFSEQQFLDAFPVICGMFFNIEDPISDMNNNNLEEVVDYLKGKGWIPWGFSIDEFKLYYELWRSNHSTLRTHMPSEKLKAKLIFFKAATFQPQEILDVLNISLVEGTEIAQWQCFAQAPIVEFTVPGSHYTMLDKENVSEISRRLHDLLIPIEA